MNTLNFNAASVGNCDSARQHLREAGASLVRSMMRARLTAEPDAFSQQQLDDWGLSNGERHHAFSLLTTASNTIREINDRFLVRCGSGGLHVEDDDLDYDLKFLIGFFVDYQWDLPNALRSSRQGEELDWGTLAQWSDVNRIRELLNLIPEIRDGTSDCDESPPVELFSISESPLVAGNAVPPISETEYQIIELLLQAFPARLTPERMHQLAAGTRNTFPEDVGRVLRDLANKDEGWRQVLALPGRGKRSGYGLRQPCDT